MTMLGALAATQRRGTGPPGSGDVARQASMGTVSYSAAPGPGLAGSGDLASEASMSLTGQP